MNTHQLQSIETHATQAKDLLQAAIYMQEGMPPPPDHSALFGAQVSLMHAIAREVDDLCCALEGLS